MTLDEIIAEARQRGDTQRAATLSQASATNPETYAEQRRQAGALGVPTAAVTAIPDEMGARAKVRQLDNAVAEAPVLRLKYADGDFARLAHDEPGVLSQIEKAVGKTTRYVMGADEGGGLPGAVYRQGYLGAKVAGAGLGRITSEWANWAVSPVVGQDNAIGRLAMRFAAEGKAAADEQEASAPKDPTMLRQMADSGFGSAAQMTKYLPLAALGPGGIAAALVGMSAESGATSFQTARQKGVPLAQSTALAGADAMAEFVTEKYVGGAKFLENLVTGQGFKKIAASMGVDAAGEMVAQVWQNFNDWMIVNPGKTAEDFVKEQPEQMAIAAGASVIGGGAQAVTYRAAARVVEAATGNALRIAEAQDDAKQLTDLFKAAADSKLLQRAPESLAAFAQQAAEHHDGIKAAYIDAQTLNEVLQQTEMPLEQVAPSVTAEAFAEALASNGTVELPIGDLLVGAAGKPVEAALLPNLRTSAEGLSEVEAKKAQGEAQKMVEAHAEEVLKAAEDEAAARASRDVVRDAVLEQLNTAGRFTPEQNTVQANLAAAFFVTMGARVGMTAEQFYAAHPLRIAAAGRASDAIDQGGGLTVEGYHYSKEDRAVLTTDQYGTGLRGSGFDAIMAHPDQRVRKRLSFYVDKGTGINPEAGVGGRGHKAKLTNIYDADQDPLRLKRGSAQDFESRVIDAGYSGYLNRMGGTQSGQVILLGDQTVKPESLGNLGKTTGTAVPAPGGKPSLGRDIAGDAVRANKGFPAGELTRERWGNLIKALEPAAYAEMQAAGLFEGEGKFYKDGLVADFESKTEAPDYSAFAQSVSLRDGRETLKKYGLTPGKKYKTREVAAALEARQRAKYGQIAKDDRSPEAAQKIAKWMAEEVLFEMEQPGASGVGWYSEKFQAALDIMAGEFPELATDKPARDLMTAIIAITSDGQKVHGNFLQALGIYKTFKETGKFETERGHQRQASIAGNLKVMQRLYEDFGPERMHTYLLREMTVGQLRKTAKEAGLDLTSDYQASIKMPMAVLEFGPKLGAFYANLMGAQGYLTMDRWWSRTFNRYRGTLLDAPTRAGLDRFKELLGDPSMSDDAAIVATIAPTKSYEDKGFKHGTELEKAANTLHKAAFDALNDAPFNATDRTFMLDAVARAQKALKRKGVDITVADIQAALWYYEKRLYGELGARQTADTSYEDAARRVVAERTAGGPSGPDVSAIEPGLDDFDDGTPRDVFQQLGLTPASLDDFSAANLPDLLNKDGWAVLTAEDPNATKATPEANAAAQAALKADLDAIGATYVDAVGKYGDVQGALIVTGIGEEQALALGRKYGQESILTRSGLVYSADGHIIPATGMQVFDKAPDDFYTEVPSTGGYFSVDLDWDNPIPGPELQQQTRGTFSPSTKTITLLATANLSTFTHELGHYFLDTMADVASQPDAPKQVVDDMNKLLAWFGVPDLATWMSMTVDQQRPHHEKLALHWENYIFEGKAPSEALKPTFQRLREFMLSAYKSLAAFLRGHNTKLNAEVRGVFDRMIASEEEIAAAERSAQYQPLFTSAADAGMTEDEYQAYIKVGDDGTKAAIDDMTARSMRDLARTRIALDKVSKQLQAEIDAQRKDIRTEVVAEVNAMPVYVAERWLRTGKVTGQDDETVKTWHAGRRLDATVLDEMYPTASATSPGFAMALQGLTQKEGMHPDLVAATFGFADGRALVDALVNRQPKQALVEAMTDERMLIEHGEMTTPEGIARAAEEAVHNDARARSLATELKMLRDANTPTAKTAGGGSVNVLLKAAKEFAATIANRTKVGKLNPRLHVAAEQRAGKKAAEASAAKKPQEAIAAKRDQLLNFHAAQAVRDGATEVRKMREFFGRVLKGNDEKVVKSGRDADVVNAARAVLSFYGLGGKTAKTASEYVDLVKQYDPQMGDVLVDAVKASEANAKPFDQLTLEEARALKDEIDAMWALSKRSRQMEVAGDLIDREIVQAELKDRLVEIGIPDVIPGERSAVTDRERALRHLKDFAAAARRVESWVGGKDGAAAFGPFRRYVWQPIKDAAVRYHTERAVYRKALGDLVKPIAATLGRRKIVATDLNGYVFGESSSGSAVQEIVHAILHTGNESNKRKLLLGREWATENADGTLDTTKWDTFLQKMIDEGVITKAHFDFAQGVWDLLEQTKPAAQATHRAVFGRYFKEVTADVFTNQFGTYRGGYVPAMTDAAAASDAATRKLMEDENASMQFAFPSTNKGFTKSRVEYNSKLLLDLNALTQHIDKVLLFTHMEQPVRDARRVLTAKEVAGPLNRIDPSAMNDLLTPWLNRAARQQVETPATTGRGAMRLLSSLRRNVGASVMFLNLANAAQQVTGLATAAALVKPKYIRRAGASFIAHPGQTIDQVVAASPYMEQRLKDEMQHLSGEIQDILVNPSLLRKTHDWTLRNAYFLQRAVDYATSPVVWKAAYNESIEMGLDEADSIARADGVVRQTQGAQAPEDVANIETGNAFVRMFTQFTGFFNMNANLVATAFVKGQEEGGLRKGLGRAVFVLPAVVLVPAILGELIAQLFKGGPPDSDDDGEYLDDWVKATLLGTAKYIAAMVPAVGGVLAAGVGQLTPALYDDRMAVPPAVSAIERAVALPGKLANAVAEGGSKAAIATRELGAFLGAMGIIAAPAVAKRAAFGIDVATDNVNPTGPVDAVRGALTGTASPESRGQ